MVEQRDRFTEQKYTGKLKFREKESVFMKKNCCCLLRAIMVIVSLPSTLHADQLEDMTAALSANSPASFLAAIETNRWDAPLIYSSWYVDKITDSGVKQRELQIRTFGKLMAERLDGWSKALCISRKSDEIAPFVESLLDLSDWLSVTNGYGNLLLASRCEDVASMGLGQLVVDINFPFVVVSGLVVRLQAPWQSALSRARMLNAEAGFNCFDVSGNDVTMIQERIFHTWQDAQRNVRAKEIRQQVPSLFEQPEGSATSIEDDPAITAMRMTLDAFSQQPVDQMTFFTDTTTASFPLRPWTTVRLWDIKRHSMFIGGDLESPNLRKLIALLNFRARIGSFPEHLSITAEESAAQEAEIVDAAKRGIHIVSAEKAYGSARKAAFASAWRKVSTSEPGIGRLACDAYEAVLAGDFVDSDTHEERLADQIKAVADQNAP